MDESKRKKCRSNWKYELRRGTQTQRTKNLQSNHSIVELKYMSSRDQRTRAGGT